MLACSRVHSPEYLLPKDEDTTAVEESEEREFDEAGIESKRQVPANTLSSQEIQAEGMALWVEAISKLETTQLSTPKPARTTVKDEQMQATLESLSEDALVASDAALLEDMQFGVPMLSGACRGFGFDLTDGNEGGDTKAGKLRMNDDSRP
jgi:hypothetical protein